MDELRRISRDVDQRLGLGVDSHKTVLAALTKAILAGVRLGAAEIAAQAIEQGADLHLQLDIGDPSIDELLDV